MGLNPIDLQTMYAQLSNAAKQAVHLTQGAQLSESMQQQAVVRKNQEEADRVNQAKENAQSKGIDVKTDGRRNGGEAAGREGGEKNESSDEKKSPDADRVKEDYLGRHIDLTR